MFRIKKLTPELIDAFVEFFDNISYDHAPHWKTCYCHYYHSNDTSEEWVKRSGESNKLASIRDIYEGVMTGFLAFEDEKCIGWVNANDIKNYKRLKDELEPYLEGKKVAITICYVIHPDYRNQGIARKLLAHAIEYYKFQGYQAMIALPTIDAMKKELHYHGTLNMYLEQNYKDVGNLEHVKIMYKNLI